MTSRMDRRDFIKGAAAAAGAASIFCRTFAAMAASAATATTESSARRAAGPDILLIMPDQMRGDCLSILNHPVVRTPHIDALARQGVLFRRAYSAAPSCIPARFGMMTGMSPQASGVVGFAARTITTPTLPDVLNEAGYQTVLVGRDMHQEGNCGYQKSILGSTYVNNDDYDKFLKQNSPQGEGIGKVITKLGVTCNWWQAKPWPLEDKLHPNEWIIGQSRDVIAKAQAQRPLFLTTSFYAPHPPLFPPREYFDACAKRNLPPIAHGDWVDWKTLTPTGKGEANRVLLEGQVLRDAQAGYFGLIDHIDAQIGSLISEFKARSEKAGRSWVIVFTTDHGEMLGDHGYFRKCEPYEGSANIPMILCASEDLGFKAGLTVNQPVCLEDLMPTLLALAGAPCPSVADGVNLVPTLRGESRQIREWLHFEHSPCYSLAQAFQALTDGHFKYIWRTADGSEQLFDLDKDPTELHDLAADPGHARELETWRARMVDRLKDRPEGFVKDGKLIAGRPYNALNAGRGAKTVGQWTPQQMKNAPTTLEMDVSGEITAAGTYQAFFLYRRGANAIEIDWVALTEDGKEIARDTHAGWGGAAPRKTNYDLPLAKYRAGAKYTLQARVKPHQEGLIDSFGEIFLTKSGAKGI